MVPKNACQCVGNTTILDSDGQIEIKTTTITIFPLRSPAKALFRNKGLFYKPYYICIVHKCINESEINQKVHVIILNQDQVEQ